MELTLKELMAAIGSPKAEADTVERPRSAYVIGQAYFIRTVTFAFVGEVVDVRDGYIFLAKSSWVADTGHLTEFCKDGRSEGMEVEVYPDGNQVALASVVDAFVWKHPLFTSYVR